MPKLMMAMDPIRLYLRLTGLSQRRVHRARVEFGVGPRLASCCLSKAALAPTAQDWGPGWPHDDQAITRSGQVGSREKSAGRVEVKAWIGRGRSPGGGAAEKPRTRVAPVVNLPRLLRAPAAKD